MSDIKELQPSCFLSPSPAPPDPQPIPATAPAEYPLLWPDDLPAASRGQDGWLWHGLLAPGNTTLLTSQWKSGKTTLISVLLSRLKTGGTLAGLPLAPGKAVVVTEEGPALWLARAQNLDFGRHVCWFCRPFPGRPRPADWLALIDQIARLRDEFGITLMVIDPLASFLSSRGENDATCMLDALAPLKRLTTRGMAVLVLHHPPKGETVAGQAARGSGALSGYVDIIIEMERYNRADDEDRRRKLQAFSRYQETPRQLVIEWTADGTDYRALGDFAALEFLQSWQTVRTILEAAPYPLTRRQTLDRWPKGIRPPDEVTLWRWLDRALDQQLVCRGGAGVKTDPYHYHLPGQMEQWRADHLGGLEFDQWEALRSIGMAMP